MDAKDFRKGNYVKYDNRIFEINSIAEEFPTLNTDEFGIGVVDWNNTKPIELTEQWLKDFGFEQFKNYEIYYKDNMPSDFQIDKTAERKRVLVFY